MITREMVAEVFGEARVWGSEECLECGSSDFDGPRHSLTADQCDAERAEDGGCPRRDEHHSFASSFQAIADAFNRRIQA